MNCANTKYLLQHSCCRAIHARSIENGKSHHISSGIHSWK